MPQTWMITGAGRGIGLALTTHLIARGDHVIAAARSPYGGALAELAGAHLARVTLVELDVTDPESIDAARKALAGRPIDVLVNNAGVIGDQGTKATLVMDFDMMRQVLDVNLLGTLRVSQAFLTNVAASQGRKIATLAGRMGSIGAMSALTASAAGALAYRSSKTALNMAMVVFGNAVREQGVTSLLLYPGWVRTEMGGADGQLSPAQSAAALIPLIDASGLDQTNSFRDWRGETIPW